MKSPSLISTLLFTGVVSIGWNLSPMLCAQTSPMDQTQASKTPDSTADKNSASTGTAQTGSPDKASTKDPTSLDKNPSAASTGSADKSATKDSGALSTTETEKQNAGGASKKLSDSDFVAKAAQGGMTEVELGKLAQEKGSSADVKQFGSHMDMDHSKANDELKALATKDNIPVPSALDEKHQAAVKHLSSLSGPAFDKAYVSMMVKDHEKTVALFKEEAASGQNADIKNFASSTLPTIESHLSDIKGIESKTK